jgi:hypothetical protein
LAFSSRNIEKSRIVVDESHAKRPLRGVDVGEMIILKYISKKEDMKM